MSFNLASLIAGTPTPTPTVSKEIKKSQKKTFTHGVNIIFKHGTYNGYHASVVDFFPASINLLTSGRAYIQADKYGPIVKPGSMLITDVGESLVEQVIPAIGGEYVPIQLFKSSSDNQLRVGRVINNDNDIMRSLMRQGKNIDEIQMMMANRNNCFLVELSLFDTSLISNMTSLNIVEDETNTLAEQLIKMQINAEMPTLLEQLSQEVQTNVSLLDKIIHPEYFEDEIEVKVVFKRDLIGPQYYLNVSSNLGDIKIYNPVKMHYLVSYKKSVEFRMNEINIEKEALALGERAFQMKHDIVLSKPQEIKMSNQKIKEEETTQKVRYFGVVKSGPYKGQRLEVVNYIPSHLEVILSSTGKKITTHIIRKKNSQGNYIIDEQNNPVFEASLILPTHVFYVDILLNNGNYAQVNKILANDSIMVTEKDEKTRKYTNNEITINDIKQLQPGFKFNEKDVTIKPDEEIMITGPNNQDDESEIQVYDEGDESQEIDYAFSPTEEVIEVSEEQPQQASFTDLQRTTFEERKLTEEEKNIKTNILNILKYLKMNDESIDVYSIIDTVSSVIKSIKNKLKKINYTTDLSVTNNMKFIIVCLVIYDLFKVGFYKNLDEVISMLFPQYFSIRDIQASSMNDNIFFMLWSEDLTQERITESVNKIREYRSNESDYPKIIKEILINADKALQGLLGLHINIIDKSLINLDELIPVGVNPLTGRRFKDEKAEADLARSRAATIIMRSQIITVEDLLNDKPLPDIEVPIIWSQVYMPTIQKFQQTIQNKADTQSDNRLDYLYIKDNLHRAPFAIRDDPMKASVRKAFEGMYKALLAHITQQQLKIEKGKKRMREAQEQILVNRSKIASIQPKQEDEEEENYDIQNTPSYIREQQKRKTQKAITKATRSANISTYKMKKEQPVNDIKWILNLSKDSEEKEAEDLIKKVQDNQPWWSKMDTSE
jgi:cell division protein FtsB